MSNINVKKIQGLSVYLAFFFIAMVNVLLSEPSFAQNDPRNYLTTEYRTAGGYSILTIDKWRIQKIRSINEKVKDLPAAIKATYINAANKLLTEKWQTIDASDYIGYVKNGNRVDFEGKYFARRNKLNSLLIAELITNDGKYMPEIVNGLWLICEESTWVLPAHLFLQKQGLGLPDPEENVIDLYTGDTGTLMAWAKALFKKQLDEFSPMVIKRIDNELKKRVFSPYFKRNDFWWQGFDDPKRAGNNWNIWINTNILLTTVLANDDEKEREAIIKKDINSADKFLNNYPEDGGCDEGPAYWGAAGGRLIEYVALLNEIADNKLHWEKYQLIHQIAAFIYKVHIADDWYVNFADAPPKLSQNPAIIFTAGKQFNDEKLKGFAGFLYQKYDPEKRIYGGENINAFIENVLLREELAHTKPAAPLLQQSWLPDLQILTVRNQTGSANGLFLGMKGGTNGESHNHNDVGSFIVYLNGSPMLVDPGSATYTVQTFGPHRYDYWVYNSQWHNCPVINGFLQGTGLDYAAKNVYFKAGKDLQSLSMDLSDAYPKEANIKTWNRCVTFDRSKNLIELAEDYELKQFIKPSELSFITPILPKLQNDGLIILDDGQPTHEHLKIKFDPARFTFGVEDKNIDDPKLKVWGNHMYRIVLSSRSASLHGNYKVSFFN